MNKDTLRLRISTSLLLTVPIIMPFVNEWVMGADEGGNHWGTMLSIVMFLFIWLPALSVFLVFWNIETALRKKGKTKAASTVSIINLFIPIVTYTICVYVLFTQ